jgi:hypothetical protein
MDGTRELSPDTVKLLMTAYADLDTVIRLHEGLEIIRSIGGRA